MNMGFLVFCDGRGGGYTWLAGSCLGDVRGDGDAALNAMRGRMLFLVKEW